MIRALVVEDEPWSRRFLVKLLEEMPGVEVVGEASDGPEGLRLVQSLNPDALFVDIRLPGLDGVSLVKQLPAPRPAVVFTTAHGEHAVEAFQEGAVHYLLKPISRSALADALARIAPRDAQQQGWLRIPARVRNRLVLFRPEEVEALVADLGDCQAWTPEGLQRVEGTLAQWEARLEPFGFFRIHRNALVRLGALKACSDSGELELPSGRLQASTRRLPELRRALEGR